MIVESIILENWKKFRDPVEIQFQDGLNIIHGPNESGKTTLMESLRTILFSKHSSRSKNIKAIIPFDSQLAPQAMITFRNNGDRYKVTKRFIQPMSALEKWNSNGWERLSEGDAADRAVASITGGELPRTGDTKPQFWGVSQCLWMVQGEPIISDELNSETFSSLQRMIGASIESGEEKRILEVLNERFSEYYTATRKDRKQSPLLKLEESLKEEKEELQKSREKLHRKDELMRNLEDNEFMKNKKTLTLKEAREELSDLQKTIEEARNHKEERERLAGEVENLNTHYNTLKEKINDITHTSEEIDDLESKNDSLEKEKKLQESELLKAESHIKQVKEEVEDLKSTMEEFSEKKTTASIAHSTVLRELQLEDKGSILKEMNGLKEELESKEESYRSINAPSRSQLDEIETLKNSIRDTRTKLDAIGLNIHASGELDGSIYLDGEEFTLDREDRNWNAYQSVRIELEKGVFEIKSGNEDVKLLKSELEDMEIECASLTAPYNETELEPLRELLNTKKGLKIRIDQINKDLAKKGGRDSLVREVAELEAKIQRNWSKIPDDSPFKNCMDGDKNDLADLLSEKINKIEEKEVFLKDNESKLQSNLKELQDQYTATDKYISQMENKVKSNEEFIEKYSERLRGLEEDGITVDSMEAQQNDISMKLERKERTLRIYQDEMEEKEEKPTKDYSNSENKARRLEEDVKDLELSHVRMESDLNNLTQDFTDMNTLEESINENEKSLEDMENDAAAIELLYDLTMHYKENTIVSLTDPIKRIVTEDLEKILGPKYSLEFDNKLKPCSVTPEGREAEALLDVLSFGTQEQIWCIFRLALGRLLSKEDKQLVVLDDPLVNTDPLRMHHALEVLEESARDMQVFVVTCDVDKYNSLSDARFISMENL